MSDTVTVEVNENWRVFTPDDGEYFTFSNQGPNEIYVRESAVQPNPRDRGFVYKPGNGGTGTVNSSPFWVRARTGLSFFHYSGFGPVVVKDLAFWLDGADAGTIVESAGAVSPWKGKSGAGNNAAQDIVAHRPLTGVTVINGVNTIKFDTLNDLLTVPPSPLLSGIWAKGGTLFMVVRSNSPGGNGTDFGEYFQHTAEWQLKKSGGDSQITLLVSFTDEDGQFNCDSVLVGGVPTILAVTYDASDVNNLPSFYKDGTLLGGTQITINPMGTPLVETGDFNIGNRGDLSRSVDSDIGEIAIYKRILSDTEISAMHSHLSTKWGIALA